MFPISQTQAAANRFIMTGGKRRGGLKRGNAGKVHRNRNNKSSISRLNQKTHMSGGAMKRMKSLIMTGK